MDKNKLNEILKDLIKLKFNFELNEPELEFLNAVSVFREKTETQAAKMIKTDPKFWKGKAPLTEAFYDEYANLIKAKDFLQILYEKFDHKDKKKGKERRAGFKKFELFLDWYYKIYKREGITKCCYCGVEEEDSKQHFKKSPNKRGRGLILEIEKIDPSPNIGYIPTNCELACYICNNAKSDFSAKEFKPIARGINAYWRYALGKYIKFPKDSDIWNK